MSRYLIGRVGQAVVVLWAAFTASFILLQALPGDAILIKFQNPDLGLSPVQIAEIRESYGADSPVWAQYLHTLGNFLTGDFGYSVQAGVPVGDGLLANLPPTFRLAAFGFALAVLLAVAIAALSSLASFSWLRSVLQALPSLFVSVPTFWLGIMLIQLFSFRLKLIPVINPGPWEGLILPMVTLAIPISAPLAQILVRNIDEVLTHPFVAVARAKGASRAWVLWRHVARNALLPTLTIAGVLSGELLAGAVITETVFGWGGVGRYVVNAIQGRDYIVVQNVILIFAIIFLVVNLIVDVLYAFLNPRIRYS